MSGVGLGAAEILAQHRPTDSGWFCRCGLELHFDPIAEAEHESSAERAFAAHQLDALKAAGYAVVSLSALRTRAHIERCFANRSELGEPDVPRHPEFYRGRAEAYDAIADASEVDR